MAGKRVAEEPVFGLWLARRRRILDLTQAELAERAGCSESTIRKLEADERRPSKRIAAALASALHVPDAESAAFVAFARAGWSDRPLPDRSPGPDLPWLLGSDLGAVRSPGAREGPATSAAGRMAATDATHRPQAFADGMPFVARLQELSRLEHALDLALAGHGQVRLVTGEAGQGKSAILRAFARWAASAHPELVTASGSCNAYTGPGDPFLPFRDILEALTDLPAALPDADPSSQTAEPALRGALPFVFAETLVKHGPHLVNAWFAAATRERLAGWGLVPADRIGSPRSDGAGSLGRIAGAPGEHALRNEAVTVLTRFSRGRPLLLLLDDVQWADRSSLDLLLHLARSLGSSAILVLAAFRPPPAAAPEGDAPEPLRLATREIARLFEDTWIDLDRADGRAFLDALLDSRPNRLGPEFRAALWRQTGGQPLFTIELLREMQQRHEVTEDAAGRWVSEPGVRWDALPGRISGALAERVERLDASSRALLRVASIEGETFTAEVAARVLGEDPATVAAATARLDRDQRLVAATGVTRTATGVLSRFRFRHSLIQRYVYENLGESERVYLHESVAEAIEALFGNETDPLAVALHYERARLPARAARFQRLAGDRAANSGALSQAIGHYQQALLHWPQDDARSRAGLLRALGECQFDHGALQDAERTLEAAHASLVALGDVQAAGAVKTALGRTYHERGDHARGLRTCRQAVAALEGEGESAELALALSMTAAMYMVASQHGPALDLGQRALEMATRVRADPVRTGALVVVGVVLARVGPDRREEGFAMLEEAHRLGDRIGAVEYAADAIGNSGLCLLALDRFAQARKQFHRTRRYARMREIGLLESWAAYGLCFLDWRRGQWKRVLRLLPRVEERVEGEHEWNRPRYRLQVLRAATDIDLGRIDDGGARLDAYGPWLSANSMEHGRAQYLRERLRVAAARGRQREADAVIGDLLEMLGDRPTHSDKVMAPLLTAVRWLVRHGDPTGAATTFVTVLERVERQYGSTTARATAIEARGALVEHDGDAGAASTHYLAAARLWAQAGFTLDEVRARGLAARTLTDTGRYRQAASQRRRGGTLVAALSAQLPTQGLVRSFTGQARALLESPAEALP